MSRKKEPLHLELVCIECSGGVKDENGAYTVCALCLLEETCAVPAAA